MSNQRTRLAASLAAAWEAEKLSILTMERLAEVTADKRIRARLLARAAGCQAHASRILARLAALGGVPLPVPPDEIELHGTLEEAIRCEADRAQLLAERYTTLANLARKVIDPSAAWVCELNHAEEIDRVQELVDLSRRCGDAVPDDTFLAPPA